MADAEEERSRMAANITKLEIENKQLETVNAQVIEENRGLLNQLEDLNNTVTESCSEVQSLTATLDSTRHELQRITMLAGRAAHLEQQLSALEIEQEQLHQELAITKDDQRSAVRRWTQAERTINNLQQQMDKIDREAREERERHTEVLQRVERQKAVETELGSAAGWSRSAAAGNEKKGSSVVSHFVTDILQDNANLQLGIVELREMLLTSNEEVESLREHMVLHQPVVSDNEDGSQKPNLRKELGLVRTENGASELHVHHHYYPTEKPEPSSKDRLPLYRRPKKKRNVTANTVTSRRELQSPRTPTSYSGSYTPASVAATILSQTSVTVPSARPTTVNHWSQQSETTMSSFAPSSVPSSPQSAFRDTVFDRSDITMDSSRPTSPESNFMESPTLFPKHRKRLDDRFLRSCSTPVTFQLRARASWTIAGKSTPTLQNNNHNHEDTTGPGASRTRQGRILEEHEPANSKDNASLPDLASEPSTDEPYSPLPTHHPQSHHRSTSHESLLSISGMDIHTHTPTPTLRSQPSQLLTRRQPITSTPTILTSSRPVLGATTTTATARTRRGYDSRDYNRSLLSSIADTSSHHNPTAHTEPGGKQTLGKKFGGWVFGKWGVAPATSPSTSPATALESGQRHTSAKAALTAVEERAVSGRRGSADKGLRTVSVEGLREKAKRSGGSGVLARSVDRGLLRESLGEAEVG